MLTNETRRELLNRAKASGFPGSIIDVFQAADQGIDLIEQHQMQQQQEQEMQVANTPEQQETGLREQHAAGNTQASMAFPDVQPNQSFNTVGMEAPIDIQKIDDQGHLVESYKNVPPGIQDLPTGPSEGTVIESPAAYQTGGVKKEDLEIVKTPVEYAVDRTLNPTEHSILFTGESAARGLNRTRSFIDRMSRESKLYYDAYIKGKSSARSVIETHRRLDRAVKRKMRKDPNFDSPKLPLAGPLVAAMLSPLEAGRGSTVIDPKTGINKYTGEKEYTPFQKGGMRGMMKAKIAYESQFGNNPAINRMLAPTDEPYEFSPGKIGTHFMGSHGEYAIPHIQDVEGKLKLTGPRKDEAIKFHGPRAVEDATYFAEHYKDVAPVFQKQKGGFDYSKKFDYSPEAIKERQSKGVDYENVELAASFAPYLGEVIDAKNTIQDLRKGNYGGAALNAAGFMMPFIPGSAIKKGYNFLKNKIKSKPKSTSDIDWGKFNKEIPSNTALMDEYKHIEDITKSRGTWMKNADGSKFKGTPEQFVQQKSKNFNLAYPEGYQSVYRGVDNAGTNTLRSEIPYGNTKIVDHRDKYTGIFSGDKGVASSYGDKVHNLAMKNSPNSLKIEGLGSMWSDLHNIGVSKTTLKKNIDSLEKTIKSGTKPKYHGGHDAAAQLKSYKNFYNKYDEIIANPKYKQLVANKEALLKSMHGKDLYSTDDLAKFLEKEGLDNIQLKYIDDMMYGDVNISNQVSGNYLKNLEGNRGTFDLTNPNPDFEKGGFKSKYQVGGFNPAHVNPTPYNPLDKQFPLRNTPFPQGRRDINKVRREELRDAIDLVVSYESKEKREDVRKLLTVTNFMENSMGHNPEAYSREYTNSQASIDHIRLDDLFDKRKDKDGNPTNYSQTQKDYFKWFKELGLPTDKEKFKEQLNSDNPLAAVAAMRMTYGRSKDPIPTVSDTADMFTYYDEQYRKNVKIKDKTKSEERFIEGYKTKFKRGGYKRKYIL